ncbi:MAG: hypothetical protein WBX16_20630, partial [Candidatus Acidiferrales bacterium]
ISSRRHPKSSPREISTHLAATNDQSILCGAPNNVIRSLGTPISRLAPLPLRIALQRDSP